MAPPLMANVIVSDHKHPTSILTCCQWSLRHVNYRYKRQTRSWHFL